MGEFFINVISKHMLWIKTTNTKSSAQIFMTPICIYIGTSKKNNILIWL